MVDHSVPNIANVKAPIAPEDGAAAGKKTASKASWAGVAEGATVEQNAASPGVLEKIAPKTREGKIIFANAVAQVASMVVAPLAVLMMEKLAPGEVKKLESYLTGVFQKHMDKIDPALGKPWRASLTQSKREAWERGDNHHKGEYLGEAISNMIMQAGANIGVTVGARVLLDKIQKTGVGTGSILFSQVVDTAVAVIGMIAIPAAMPERMMNARESLREYLENKQETSRGWRRILGENPRAPRQFALNTVNFAIPDLIGFTTGTYTMLEKARRDKKENEQETAISV